MKSSSHVVLYDPMTNEEVDGDELALVHLTSMTDVVTRRLGVPVGDHVPSEDTHTALLVDEPEYPEDFASLHEEDASEGCPHDVRVQANAHADKMD